SSTPQQPNRKMEITLSNLDLSQSDEKRKKWKAISSHSNAYVLGQKGVFGDEDVTVGRTERPLPEGKLSIKPTKSHSNAKDDSKLTVTLAYHDSKEAEALETLGDIARNVAKELTSHLDITINRDDSNKLTAALEARNVDPREQEVIKLTITGMDRYLNADKGTGPKPLFPDEGFKRMDYDIQEDLHTITQTKEISGDGAGVITASSSEYRDPNQQGNAELKTDGKITVEFRPKGNVTELSNAAVQAFAHVVVDMKRGLRDADVILDVNNPPKHDNSLNDLVKKPASVAAVQPEAAVPEPNLEGQAAPHSLKPAPVAAVKAEVVGTEPDLDRKSSLSSKSEPEAAVNSETAVTKPNLQRRTSLASFEDNDEELVQTPKRPSWTRSKPTEAAPDDEKEAGLKKSM
ncbi:MAG: hypothetical protein M3R00_10375, partial [Pseudomonadota bacterium]|nr:hypothetical protein [Pseudomonadota bacterium]